MITAKLLSDGSRAGTVWFAAPGVAITAAHCIGDRKQQTVRQSSFSCVGVNRERALKVLEADFRLDVALLEVTPTVPLEAVLALAGRNFRGKPGLEWTVHAYPDAKGDGLTVNGRIDSMDGVVEGTPAMQLTCNQGGLGYLQGCSGGPVVSGEHEEVIGVIRWAPEDLAQRVMFATRIEDIVARFEKYLPKQVQRTERSRTLNAVTINRVLEVLLARDRDVNLFAESYAVDAYRDFTDNMERGRKISLIAACEGKEAVVAGIYEALDRETDTEKRRRLLDALGSP
jgi:hypothetical protein